MKMNITVYLGANAGNDPKLQEAVEALGKWIGENGHDLIYGGSKCGLMGSIAESVLKNGPLLRKVYIPKYIFPLEKCCFALVNFFFSLVALFIVALLTWSHISLNTVLLAIYPIVMLFAFSLGVGLILSTMYVFVRDIMHIWEVFCTLLVYGSAIFYDPRQMESWMQYIINLNPIYWYITSVRSCVMWGEGLTPNMVLIPFLCAALSLGLGVYVFKKNQDKFVLYM